MAQTSRIGIVFMADTALVHQHVGLTIFENSIKPLPLDITLSKYIEERLMDYLTPDAIVSICELPDSLKGVKMGLLETGIGKKLSKWASSKNNEYDIIIFVKNMDATFGYNSSVSAKASGVYTKMKEVYLYSTITYYAYDTARSKLMGYDNKGGNFLHQLKNVNFPKNQKYLTPEILDFITYEFKKYINSRIEYFISKSKLMSQDAVLAKSALIYKDKDIPRSDSLGKKDEPFKDDIY